MNNLEKSSIAIKTPFIPTEVLGNGDKLTHITLQEVKGDTTETLEIDDFIINYGFVSSLGPIKNWGLELERNSIVVNSKMETSIPGIYCAGDICTYDGKVKLIATGFGEAPTAVNNAMNFIDQKPACNQCTPHLYSNNNRNHEATCGFIFTHREKFFVDIFRRRLAMNVLVIGANGKIGRLLVEKLAMEKGFFVRAMVRKAEQVSELENLVQSRLSLI